MKHCKRRAFVHTTNTPSLSNTSPSSPKYYSISESRTLRHNISSRNLMVNPKKVSVTRMTCNVLNAKYWLVHPFPLVPWQFTSYPKLPFEVLGSPIACKCNNSSRGCPKPLCLDDISDFGNEKGPNKTMIRKSPPATSLQARKLCFCFNG